MFRSTSVVLCAVIFSLVTTLSCSGSESEMDEGLRLLELHDFSELVPDDNWEIAGNAYIDPAHPRQLLIEEGTGVLAIRHNGRPVSNLFTLFEHGDIELKAEFMVPQGSNSGIYFQGRYEVQILDSWQVEDPTHHDVGGIYLQHGYRPGHDHMFAGSPPKVNVARPPGVWQEFHILFRAPRFDEQGEKTADARFEFVYMNGELIQRDVEVAGPTASPAFEDEAPQGPLKLQGTHGPVAFRNIRYRKR